MDISRQQECQPTECHFLMVLSPWCRNLFKDSRPQVRNQHSFLLSFFFSSFAIPCLSSFICAHLQFHVYHNNYAHIFRSMHTMRAVCSTCVCVSVSTLNGKFPHLNALFLFPFLSVIPLLVSSVV